MTTVTVKFFQSVGCRIGKIDPEYIEVAKNAFLKTIPQLYEDKTNRLGNQEVFRLKGVIKPRPVVTIWSNGKIKVDNIAIDELKIKV